MGNKEKDIDQGQITFENGSEVILKKPGPVIRGQSSKDIIYDYFDEVDLEEAFELGRKVMEEFIMPDRNEIQIIPAEKDQPVQLDIVIPCEIGPAVLDNRSVKIKPE